MVRCSAAPSSTSVSRNSKLGEKSETDDDDQDTSLTEVKGAIEYIVTLFRQPLEARGVDVLTLPDEIEDAVDYARRYLGLESTNKHP